MNYDTLRHLADTVGLAVMALVFVGLCVWPFRAGARSRSQEAANMIFKDEDNG